MIGQNSSVILYAGISKLKLTQTQAGKTEDFGGSRLKHDQMVGQSFGSRVGSTGVYALQPCSVLLTETLTRKTQILFQADISAIVSRLNILPGNTVVQTGTGSGSLSLGFLQSLMGRGHLYTFQFNAERAGLVQTMFKKVGYENVTVSCRDTCEVGFKIQGADYSADAVFLDLPSPWLAVKHAVAVLRPGGRICSFSPCLEQVQKSIQAFRENSIWGIETIEILARKLQRKQRSVPEVLSGTDQKITSYSSGAKQGRGHTGYLTFGQLIIP